MPDRPARAASDFPVVIGSELLGDVVVLASRVTERGMLAATGYRVPVGSIITVHFGTGLAELVARAEVAAHVPLGMSLRFLTWS